MDISMDTSMDISTVYIHGYIHGCINGYYHDRATVLWEHSLTADRALGTVIWPRDRAPRSHMTVGDLGWLVVPSTAGAGERDRPEACRSQAAPEEKDLPAELPLLVQILVKWRMLSWAFLEPQPHPPSLP